MQPLTRTFIVKNHCLAVVTDAWTDWQTAASDALVAVSEMISDEPTQREVDLITNELPDTEDVVAWIKLLFGFTVVHREMRYEDDQYLAMARSHLLDALVAIADGDFETAARETDGARDRLALILSRRRSGTKQNTQLTLAGRTMVVALEKEMTAMHNKLASSLEVSQW